MKAQIFHEDAFNEFFEPYVPAGCNGDSFGGIGLNGFGSDLEVVRKIPEQFVWSVTEELGEYWISPGLRYVNRLNYLITSRPHNFMPIEFRSYKYRPFLTEIGRKRLQLRLHKLLGVSAFTEL